MKKQFFSTLLMLMLICTSVQASTISYKLTVKNINCYVCAQTIYDYFQQFGKRVQNLKVNFPSPEDRAPHTNEITFQSSSMDQSEIKGFKNLKNKGGIKFEIVSIEKTDLDEKQEKPKTDDSSVKPIKSI